MVALGVGIASSYLMQTVFMDTRLWLILTGAVSLLLPLILLAGESLRRKGAKL